jgi:hypothetical protein
MGSGKGVGGDQMMPQHQQRLRGCSVTWHTGVQGLGGGGVSGGCLKCWRVREGGGHRRKHAPITLGHASAPANVAGLECQYKHRCI